MRDGAGELFPEAAEQALDVAVEVHLCVRESGVNLVLVRGEEGPELGLVEPCRARCLGQGKVEEKQRLDGVV